MAAQFGKTFQCFEPLLITIDDGNLHPACLLLENYFVLLVRLLQIFSAPRESWATSRSPLSSLRPLHCGFAALCTFVVVQNQCARAPYNSVFAIPGLTLVYFLNSAT